MIKDIPAMLARLNQAGLAFPRCSFVLGTEDDQVIVRTNGMLGREVLEVVTTIDGYSVVAKGEIDLLSPFVESAEHLMMRQMDEVVARKAGG